MPAVVAGPRLAHCGAGGLHSHQASKLAMASSITCLACLFLRAVGGELLQQHREFSLDLDHLAGLVELPAQAFVLLAQGSQLTVFRIGRCPPRGLGQGLTCTGVTDAAPLGDMGGVEALTS